MTRCSASCRTGASEHDLWVLSDEIYARIIYGGEYLSMLRYPGMQSAR